MRHRIKKIPSLILRRKTDLLHSDKSILLQGNTQPSLLGACAHTSSFGRSGPLGQVLGRAKEVFAASKRGTIFSSKKVFTEAAHTYFYNNKHKLGSFFIPNNGKEKGLSNIPLVLSSGALLLILGLMMFPTIDNEVMALGSGGVEQDNDYGIDTQAELNLSLGLSGSSIGSNEDGSAPAVVGKPSYGGVTLTATATDINPLTGYSIYVQTTGADTRLKNNIDDSNVIDTITEEAGVTGENIPLNQWGYAIERLESADQQVSYPTMTFKGVSPSGDTSATAAHGKENLNNAKFALAFGANIGSDKLAGHYRTDVLVSLVAEAKTMVTYSLSYDGNGNTSGTAPNTATVESREDSYEFTVAGKGTLEKTNAEFLGWAKTADATEAEYTEGSKLTLYRKSDEENSVSNQTLYAVWKTTSTPTTPVTNWNDLTYLQQMSPGACNSVTTPAAKTSDGKINTDVPAKQLIDSRDGKTYWIAKLADGNCWMTQNLDLDLYVNGANRTLTPEDSNVLENWPSADKPGTGPSTKEGYYSSSSGYYKAQYYDPGYAYYTDNGTTKNDLSEADGKALATNTSGDTNAHSLQGNLYSWTATTAGTGTSSVTSGDTPSSICPKGWKLPTSANTDVTKNSFGGLTTTYSISNNSTGSGLMRASPFYFIYGGYVDNSSFSYAGSYGYYWSSTANGSYYAYNLFLNSSNAYPSSTYNRYSGYSVRCVAK